ncbi:MAG TPA: SUMF1/EgtB/PvdO family nonheme iron enzyme [Bryobacteraceae bacterium]|nr:SUMF1/EgtB/PvdO family nonheme iron enzyme [Bryobacteraceae bacterium]
MAASPTTGRESMLAELNQLRANTDALFAALRPEAIYARAIPERHRLIFYLGHLEAFDWNTICRRTLGMESFHPSFDTLFEAGIDPPEGQLPADGPEAWPRVEEVLDYNGRVRREVDRVFDTAPREVAVCALEHRLMHAETFAYLLHNLDAEDKPGICPDTPIEGAPWQPEFISIPGGTATLGQAPGEFGWDNEFERHTARVPEFSIGRYKVTNGEYLRFVEDGGEVPYYWTRQGSGWFYRGMRGLIPLPSDWPVYVTHEQAEAYARYHGATLPTEAQFHRAAFGTPSGGERSYPWGEGEPAAGRGNFDFHRWDPVPVTATPEGDSAFGVAQMVGNGWEWTSTVFGPFDGFRTFSFYPGYSKNFFDGEHFVLKGGSPRTGARLLRRSFRNWFRRRYPYMYATFRLVRG